MDRHGAEGTLISSSCCTPTTHTGLEKDSLRGTTTTVTTTPPTNVLHPRPSSPQRHPGAVLTPKIPLISTFTTDIVTIAMLGQTPVLVLTSSHPNLPDVSYPRRRQTAHQTIAYAHAVVTAGEVAPHPGSLEASRPHPDVTLPHFQQPCPSPSPASANERRWHVNVFGPPLKHMSSTPFQPISSAPRI